MTLMTNIQRSVTENIRGLFSLKVPHGIQHNYVKKKKRFIEIVLSQVLFTVFLMIKKLV